MTDFLSAAVEIARQAGTLLAELSTQPLEIEYKRRADVVTIADRRSEASAEKSAAKSLDAGLGAQRGDLRIGVLPAGLIIIIGLRQWRGAGRDHCQDRPSQPGGE